MQVNVTGRHFEVPARFVRHIEEKLDKVPHLDPRVMSSDVIVAHETNPRRAKEAYRIEITCHARRSVIRAEAAADDEYAALDLATTKLLERLRRQHDKRKVARGQKRPISVGEATAELAMLEVMPNTGGSQQREEAAAALALGADEDSPVTLREKVHKTTPMSIDDALREMELVGHDFYLYFDKDANQPSVVYRRRGWSYGVLHLDVVDESELAPTE